MSSAEVLTSMLSDKKPLKTVKYIDRHKHSEQNAPPSHRFWHTSDDYLSEGVICSDDYLSEGVICSDDYLSEGVICLLHQ